MKYVSTRGQRPRSVSPMFCWPASPATAGSIVPETWPRLAPEAIAALAGRPYAEVALQVIRPFVGGEIADDDAPARCASRPMPRFRHPAVAPLVQIGPGEWVLELFHGPTLAFKDVAMQLLARLMDHVLAERGERVTIVGATSGDTGGGGDRGLPRPRQRRHLHPLSRGPRLADPAAADDDGRSGQRPRHRGRGHLRRLPGDGEGAVRQPATSATGWRSPASTRSTGRGSSPRSSTTSPPRSRSARRRGRSSFTVPTGNFGDVFAGYVAKRMGLPIERLVDRHQRQRHPRPHARDRPLRDARRPRRPRRRRWTSRSRPISSGCCSRPMAATPAPSGGLMERPRAEPAPSPSPPAPLARDPRGFRRPAGPTRPRPRRPSREMLRDDRLPARSAYRRRRSPSAGASVDPACRW